MKFIHATNSPSSHVKESDVVLHSFSHPTNDCQARLPPITTDDHVLSISNITLDDHATCINLNRDKNVCSSIGSERQYSKEHSFSGR